MKRLLSLLLCISLLAGLPACGSPVLREAAGPPAEPDTLDGDFVPVVQDFSWRFASGALDGTGNANCSPVSLYLALAAVSTGAGSQTREELFSLLGAQPLSDEELATACANLFAALQDGPGNPSGIQLANSLWLCEELPCREEFVERVADRFYASVFQVDFADPGTGRQMSDWVREQTNGLLKPQITTRDGQSLSMLNTIYFKSGWSSPFTTLSDPAPFHLADGSTVDCTLMRQGLENHPFRIGDGYTASYGLFENGSRMVFVLPDEDSSVDALLASPKTLAEAFTMQQAQAGEVTLLVPQFTVQSDFQLIETLRQMGVTSAFLPEADFSGISDSPSFISGITQQTRLSLDENGVEAAAYTEVAMTGSAAPSEEQPLRVELRLDRPFLYALVDQGVPLFVGVVRDPSLT